jgi:lipopolysaccharide transport system permease protein
MAHERTHAETEEFLFDGLKRVSLRHALWELWVYRETVWAFAIRSLRIRYKQAILGFGWAVVQPLAFLGVFVIVFGGVAGLKGGGATYAAFALSALVPWGFISSGVTNGADALIQDRGLVRKVYFPREAPVLGAIGSYIPDFLIGMVLVLVGAPLTGAHIGWWLAFVPVLFVAIVIPTAAIAIPIGAFALYYRDFKYALPFAVQVWLFASPVAYPVTQVGKHWRWLYAAANPIVGPIDSFRHVLAVGNAPDWGLLGISMASSLVLFMIGFRIFKKLEPEFADVV